MARYVLIGHPGAPIVSGDLERRTWTQVHAQAYGVSLPLGTELDASFDADVERYLLSMSALTILGATPPSEAPPAGAVIVSSLTGDWAVTNPSVALESDGVHFGPYPDGGATGGSIRYYGLNDQPLSAIQTLIFTIDCTSDEGVVMPYLRAWTQTADGNTHDAIYSPPDHAQTQDATGGLWRYDDDDASGGEFGDGAPFSDVLATHGDEPILRIGITTGWTPSTNLSALLTDWHINSTHFQFVG